MQNFYYYNRQTQGTGTGKQAQGKKHKEQTHKVPALSKEIELILLNNQNTIHKTNTKHDQT